MAIAIDPPIQQKPLSFDEFLAHYGGNNRYELIDGEVFDLEHSITLNVESIYVNKRSQHNSPIGANWCSGSVGGRAY
jgi:hypothetical protein